MIAMIKTEQSHVTSVDRVETFDWEDDGSSLYGVRIDHRTNVELTADMQTVLNRHRSSAHVKVRDYSMSAPVVDVDVDKRDALKLSQMFADLAEQLDDPFDDIDNLEGTH